MPTQPSAPTPDPAFQPEQPPATPVPRSLYTSAASLAAALGLVGIAYGVQAVDGGFPLWFAPLLGIIVLAGSAEMLFVGLVAAGTSPWFAALAGLTVNIRHLPYGVSVRRFLTRKYPQRIAEIHVMNDEAVAFGLAHQASGHGRRAYLAEGYMMLGAWPLGALAGGLLGRFVPPETLGLDALFPAAILALVLPALKRREFRPLAITGIAITAIGTFLVPASLGPLLALAALPLIFLPSQAAYTATAARDATNTDTQQPDAETERGGA